MLRVDDLAPYLPPDVSKRLRRNSNITNHDNLSKHLKNLSQSTLMRYIQTGSELPHNTTPQRLAEELFRWSTAGFPRSSKWDFKRVKTLQAIVLAWLCPVHLNGARTAPEMWKLATSISNIIGLHDLHKNLEHRKHLRLLIRGFGIGVQRSFLTRQYGNDSWKTYNNQLFLAVWHHTSVKQNSSVYISYMLIQKTFYIGKTDTTRVSGLPGPVARYQEHLLMTFRHFEKYKKEKRYRVWKFGAFHEFVFLPFVWSSTQAILKYERFLINYMQAPIQDRVRSHTFRPSRFRLYPRFRTSPSPQRELELNQCYKLVEFTAERSQKFSVNLFDERCLDSFQSYPDLLRYCKQTLGIPSDVIRYTAYKFQIIPWLTLMWAHYPEVIDYAGMWNTNAARVNMLQVWACSLYLPHRPAVICQRKIDRFLQTSPLLGTGSFTIKVSTHQPGVIRNVRRVVQQYLRFLHASDLPELALYLRYKIKVLAKKGKRLGDDINSHIKAARQFTLDKVQSISPQQFGEYREWKDVSRSQFNWDLPIELSPAELQSDIRTQFHRMISHYRVAEFSTNFDLDERTHNLVQIPESQRFLQHLIPHGHCDDILVTVDKDSKRKMWMSKQGYLARLYDEYVLDSKFYTPRLDISPQSLADFRKHTHDRFLPGRSLRRNNPYTPKHNPRAYHCYKSKCANEHGQLCCKKQHSHFREIISDFSNPIKPQLSIIAKAIRQCKQLSHEFCWTLWRQTDMENDINSKLSRLASPPECRLICPCGKPKLPLTMIKLDAAQFFKNSDLLRCISRMGRLLDRIERLTGYNAVTVSKIPRQKGHLCYSSRRPSSTFHVVPFKRIRQALQILKHDNFYTLGDVVMERKGGWPMGGVFSEVGTLIDLQESLLEVEKDPVLRHQCGWSYRNYTFQQQVVGSTHVDDSLCFSRIYCETCVFQKLRNTLPDDVGLEQEEAGKAVRYLSGFTVLDDESEHISVLPYNPNIRFALNLDQTQKTARLGTYMGPGVHHFRHLFHFLLGRLLTYHHLCNGRVKDVRLHVFLLFLEIYRLGWPVTFIIKTCQKVPRRHQSALLTFCRQCARSMKHSGFASVISLQILNQLINESTANQLILDTQHIPFPLKTDIYQQQHDSTMGYGKNKGSGWSNNSWWSWGSNKGQPQSGKGGKQSWNPFSWFHSSSAQQAPQPLVITTQPQAPPQPVVIHAGPPAQPMPEPQLYPAHGTFASQPLAGTEVYPTGHNPQAAFAIPFTPISMPTTPQTTPHTHALSPELLYAQQRLLQEQQAREQLQKQAASSASGHDSGAVDPGFVLLRATKHALRRLTRQGSDENPSGPDNSHRPPTATPTRRRLIEVLDDDDYEPQSRPTKHPKADPQIQRQLEEQQHMIAQLQQQIAQQQQQSPPAASGATSATDNTPGSASTTTPGMAPTLPLRQQRPAINIPFSPIPQKPTEQEIREQIRTLIWSDLQNYAKGEFDTSLVTTDTWATEMAKVVPTEKIKTLLTQNGGDIPSGNPTRARLLTLVEQKLFEKVPK